jgi:hypothetical protein
MSIDPGCTFDTLLYKDSKKIPRAAFISTKHRIHHSGDEVVVATVVAYYLDPLADTLGQNVSETLSKFSSMYRGPGS